MANISVRKTGLMNKMRIETRRRFLRTRTTGSPFNMEVEKLLVQLAHGNWGLD